MLAADGLIDLLIPRGGKSLVARVQAEAKVPVLAHLDGINHVYVDGSADHEMARRVVRDAKMRRTGICGAMETLLIDQAYCHPAELVAELVDAGCTVRGDEALREIVPGLDAATPEDWDTEYLDAIASVALVDGVEGAMAHIAAHGSHHTDAIVARDEAVAERFWRRSTAPSCCGTPRPNSPMAASSGWVRRSVSRRGGSMRAGRSRWRADHL